MAVAQIVRTERGAVLAAASAGLPILQRLLSTCEALPVRKPLHWPGPEPPASCVRLSWDDDFLYAFFECAGTFRPAQRSDALARWEACEGIPAAQRTLLCDDRVSLFVMRGMHGGAAGQGQDQHQDQDQDRNHDSYYGFECNAAGATLTYRVDVEQFRRTGRV